MGYREDLLSLPAEERLEYALDIIEEITGTKKKSLWWVMENYGLTKTEAQLFLMLNNNFPRIVSIEALYNTIWGDTDAAPEIVRVYVCKMRSKGLKIITHWGVGYSVEEYVDVGEAEVPDEMNKSKKWTEEEDLDLITMVQSKSSLRSMAYEFDRTERAVKERIMKLRKQGRIR